MANGSAKRVIVVSKHRGNSRVLAQAVTELEMVGIPIVSEDELNQELEGECAAQTALVDVTGFGRTVWQLCEILQRNNVAFIVLAASQDQNIGDQTLTYGATSVLQKPVAKDALLNLVRNICGDQ